MQHHPSHLIELIRKALAAGEAQKARGLLLADGTSLLQPPFLDSLVALLQQIQADQGVDAFPDVDADIALLTARCWLAMNHLHNALESAETARLTFAENQQVEGELRACLMLGQIHHRREDLGTAYLYTEEAAELLRSHPTLSPRIQADVYLGLARLAPDVGQLSQGLHFAQHALNFYRLSHDAEGEIESTLLMSGIARQMGRFQLGATHLEMARQCFLHTRHKPWVHAYLQNGVIHQYWFQGTFALAADVARSAIEYADKENLTKFRVYQRLALANVLRGWGHYDEAARLYAETEQIIQKTGFTLFQVWVYANWAWLNALEQNYTVARRRLFSALETTDRGQAASFNVFLAGIYSLTERYAEAEQLLQRSLHFYQTSGDELSIFALRMHLAYVYLQLQRTERAEEEMTLGLVWAAQWNVDYFPHWWHPQIVAVVCTHAFVTEIQPSLAERILVRRIGERAIPLLQRLTDYASPRVARRIVDALAVLNLEFLANLTNETDGPVGHALADLFADGRLQSAKLPSLTVLLSTTHQDTMANPVLLATFGLYLQGLDRREIAEHLQRSEATIRNYITVIYERFGLPEQGLSRRQRFNELRQLAIDAGYIRAP